MSWIFGFHSKRTYQNLHFEELHDEALASLKRERFYLAIGGNKNTCFYNLNDNSNQFMLCGVPIAKGGKSFLNNEDISRVFSKYNSDISNLNGHFCGVAIGNNSIKLFTDKLGLREFHIFENEERFYFSTRLDWLLKLGSFEIDFNEFGSKWNLINQIATGSIVKNITRLNCGSEAVINGSLQIIENKWMPVKGNDISKEEFLKKLEKFILTASDDNTKLSLSLSGGMDSRVILSVLMNCDYKNWDCHTFDTSDRKDKEIVNRIFKNFEIPYRIYSTENCEDGDIVEDLFDYIGQTYLTESGFISRNLMYYKNLPTNEVIIDGGFAEFWRRVFFSRLKYLGKKDLSNKNYEGIVKYLVNNKADLFNDEVNSLMNKGVIKQLEAIFNTLPEIKEVGTGNWLDLLALKTRLVNYAGPEQVRIDSFVKSYMPFVQLDLMNDLLNIPIETKANNKLFNEIIKVNERRLLNYPLAKGDVSYPYYLNPILKNIYSKLYKKLNGKKGENRQDPYLENLKEFALDSLNSLSAKDYTAYDYSKVYYNVNAYYYGDKTKAHYVDWFITFEVFRQILEKRVEKNNLINL